MSSDVEILSIETLHLWVTIDKKKTEKAIRYARIHIDAKGNKTHEVLEDDKWTEVKAETYHAKAEEIRSALIGKLKSELLKEVKDKIKPRKNEKSKEAEKPQSEVKSENKVLKTDGNHVIVEKK